MGIVLVKKPPEEAYDFKVLLKNIKSGYFEGYLIGVTAYAARRYLEDIFADHFEGGEHRFWPMDEYELEDLFAGNGKLEYWQLQAGNMKDMLQMKGARPTPIMRLSLLAALALAEGEHMEAIEHTVLLSCLCEGARYNCFVKGKNRLEMNDDDKQACRIAMSVLIEALHFAFDNPDKVLLSTYPYLTEEDEIHD